MKQSSIEWLISEIQRHNDAGYEFNPKHEEEIIEQAEQMHKQEMIDFATKYNEYCHNSFIQNRHQSIKSAEEFYNETLESALPISDNEYKKIIKALYPKDNSRAFKKE